jgi:oligoendopeptidase F
MMDKSWDEIAPLYEKLLQESLTADTIHQWLRDWSTVDDQLNEARSRITVEHTLDTTNETAKQRYYNFIENIAPAWRQANFEMQKKLVGSGLNPAGLEVPMRNVKGAIDIFREENQPLLVEEAKLGSTYNEIIGTQTVEWDGEEQTLLQVGVHYKDPDRTVREKAWRVVTERQLADREAINANWVKLLQVRRQIAENAGFDNYRDYAWINRNRWDYTPEDAYQFHQAIEEVVVPAATRIYERDRELLGVDTLRPWDDADPYGFPPLKPFESMRDFVAKAGNIFMKVHPDLGKYFETMRNENLLDLDNRKGKAPGGYCTSFEVAKRPFIFMNAVGIQRNVNTLLHEGGHAFHVFEMSHIEYHLQNDVPPEFAEVASMSMELLGAPYLEAKQGGYYSPIDAARARVEHLKRTITLWPYMAVVSAFQHWVYENIDDAMEPANCDAAWGRLWDRFMPGVDWSGLEDSRVTRWQRQLHIHRWPFYYIEYGLAQLGAVQVWHNSLGDPDKAIADYRRALSLGATVSLPDLFAAAGAKFAFDAETLGRAVDLVMTTIDELESQIIN